MATIYLALGSNLGDRSYVIKRAINELKMNGIKIRKISSIIETDQVDSQSPEKYKKRFIKANTRDRT